MKKLWFRRLVIGLVLLVVGLGVMLWLGISLGRSTPAVMPANSQVVEARSVPALPAISPAPTMVSPPTPRLNPPLSRPPLPMSVSGDVSTFITFSNRSKGTMAIFWIDYDGDMKKYFDLEPGTSYTQQTYVSHPWVGINERGEEYPVIVADGSANQEMIFLDDGAKVPPQVVTF